MRILEAYSNLRADRDGGKWKLDAEKTQRRRELFYELLTYDSWQVSCLFLLLLWVYKFGANACLKFP